MPCKYIVEVANSFHSSYFFVWIQCRGHFIRKLCFTSCLCSSMFHFE